MDINELRLKIDQIDEDIINAFGRRMEVSAEIARFKQENNLPVHDPARERQKLFDLASKADEDMKTYVKALYSLLFELSRSYQHKLLGPDSGLAGRITEAVEKTEKIFPSQAVVACQGVEGAYSQKACEKLFELPGIVYCNTFESVFAAIDSGLCRYGVLPLENSTAGSINRVYDLMMKYNFNIVRSTRLKINHCLLTQKGSALSDIKEVFSHEQAINQSSEYLKGLGVKVTACANTAIAAQMVAESQRSDVAALSSKECAELYGLKVAASAVQDNGNNYTRFICISKALEIYPGSDKTSVMMSIPHKPGSLYKVLSRFYALGINLIKLESRPMADRDFEFMFYFDLETPVYSAEFVQLIGDLEAGCEEFRYLGSYLEII